jgi:hypothetical protein
VLESHSRARLLAAVGSMREGTDVLTRDVLRVCMVQCKTRCRKSLYEKSEEGVRGSDQEYS